MVLALAYTRAMVALLLMISVPRLFRL